MKKLIKLASYGWKGIIIPKNAKPAIYDKDLNVIKYVNQCGSGCYSNAIFACRQCGKWYCTVGALRRYHKKCNEKVLIS